MLCPKCSSKTTIPESRVRKGNFVKRIRKCTKCNFMFNTIEIAYTLPGMKKISKETLRNILEEKNLVLYLIAFLEDYLKLKEHPDMVEFQLKDGV